MASCCKEAWCLCSLVSLPGLLMILFNRYLSHGKLGLQEGDEEFQRRFPEATSPVRRRDSVAKAVLSSISFQIIAA